MSIPQTLSIEQTLWISRKHYEYRVNIIAQTLSITPTLWVSRKHYEYRASTIYMLHHMGRVKRKNAFEHTQNAYSDHPAHTQSIIRALVALHSQIVKYPMILSADSE